MTILEFLLKYLPSTTPTVLDFVSPFIWPATVLLILMYFRKPICRVLDRLQEAGLPGGAWAKLKPLDQAVAPRALTRTSKRTYAEMRLGHPVDRNMRAAWENTANTYWAGYDICNAWYGLMFGAGKRQLLYLLQQCYHHVDCLEFSDSRFKEHFSKLFKKVESTPETDLDQAMRRKLANDVFLLRDHIGAHMEVHQPGFTGFPEGPIT